MTKKHLLSDGLYRGLILFGALYFAAACLGAISLIAQIRKYVVNAYLETETIYKYEYLAFAIGMLLSGGFVLLICIAAARIIEQNIELLKRND